MMKGFCLCQSVYSIHEKWRNLKHWEYNRIYSIIYIFPYREDLDAPDLTIIDFNTISPVQLRSLEPSLIDTPEIIHEKEAFQRFMRREIQYWGVSTVAFFIYNIYSEYIMIQVEFLCMFVIMYRVHRSSGCAFSCRLRSHWFESCTGLTWISLGTRNTSLKLHSTKVWTVILRGQCLFKFDIPECFMLTAQKKTGMK